jgi:hypothetical protein
VKDELNSRLEQKSITLINLILAIWLRSQVNNCLCRTQASTLFVLTFVFVSLIKCPVQPFFYRPRAQIPPLIGISVPTEGHGEVGARAVNINIGARSRVSISLLIVFPTPSAEMKGKASPTKFLGNKTI